MARYILALDQGTTSSRAMLFNEWGNIVSLAQEEFPQHFPQPGWVEHDAMDIWDAQLRVARNALEQVAAKATEIAAIGITNQRETTLIWERASGRPIHRAIVWQDRRTASLCDALRAEGFDRRIAERTGLVTDPYFSATKVAWLLENVVGARQKAERGELAFGTMDAWLVWQLTAGASHITDISNASRTMLFDIHSGSWCTEILERLNIPPSLLPTVVPSSAVVGETVAACFGAAIPIAGMAGDQQAATFGQVCTEAGMAKNTYGTGCFLLMQTGRRPVPSAHQLLTTIAWQIGEAEAQYALEGSVFVAGAAVQWLRDELAFVETSAASEAIATSVADSGGVYLVPAFTGLGAPYWDAYARGAIVGLSRGSGRAEIVRAALESIAYQSRDVVEVMRKDADLSLHTLRVDGGVTQNDFVMQFQADILGVPVERPVTTETTALGAAYLAGLAVGFWPSMGALKEQWRLDRVFEPQISAAEREERYAGWLQAVARVRSDVA